VQPLVWDEVLAAVAAAVPTTWLIAIEVGTSRRQPERLAPDDVVEADVVQDEVTGKWFDVAALVAVGAAVPASLLLTDLTVAPRTASFAVGLGAMFAAVGLSAWARRHLGRFHRHALTAHHDHEVVITGPYRVVRHPIYTATVLAFVGIGFALGNWSSVLVLAVLPTAALVHRIRVEEQILEDRFGASYADGIPHARLVPGLW
jgi:protein-S-isoprenylcysteine O-methyltransferase Ste14